MVLLIYTTILWKNNFCPGNLIYLYCLKQKDYLGWFYQIILVGFAFIMLSLYGEKPSTKKSLLISVSYFKRRTSSPLFQLNVFIFFFVTSKAWVGEVHLWEWFISSCLQKIFPHQRESENCSLTYLLLFHKICSF